MIKIVITTAILMVFAAGVTAQDITCADLESNLKTYGSSELTGLVLVSESSPDSSIVSKVVFRPHYDMHINLISPKGENDQLGIKDLVDNGDEIVFYTKPLPRTNKREGEQLVFKKLGDDRYEMTINYAPQYEFDFDTSKYTTVWGDYKWILNRETKSTTAIFKATDESLESRKNAKCK